jgi:uncharacterized HAD superfamily protein
MHRPFLRIGVDIDGVLTKETEGHDYENRTPVKEMISWLRDRGNEGHHIILFSSRFPEDAEVTRSWLKRNNVCYDQLILGKPQFDIYIDDISKTPQEVLNEKEESCGESTSNSGSVRRADNTS